MASHVAILNAMYSAYVELSSMDFYFLLHQETTPNPILKQHPIMIFLSTKFPAQYASVYPIKLKPFPQAYHK